MSSQDVFHATNASVLLIGDLNMHSNLCKAALCQGQLLKCFTNKTELNCIMLYPPCCTKLYWHPFFINVVIYKSLFDIQGYSRHNYTFHWYTVTLSVHHRSNAIVQLDKMRQLPWQTHDFKQPVWLTQFILTNWASEKYCKKSCLLSLWSLCFDMSVMLCALRELEMRERGWDLLWHKQKRSPQGQTRKKKNVLNSLGWNRLKNVDSPIWIFNIFRKFIIFNNSILWVYIYWIQLH